MPQCITPATLTHQDTRSCAGNRFICHTGGAITMPGVSGGFSAYRIRYDVSQNDVVSQVSGAWLVLPGHG